ncbi:winged helix-turn-helix domain-containing protein [Proteus hauseri]|uniref:winged helix-turn-helix domain-containing protein n=1 Tax=Proteus hauseri TaxID=183417 RepID=UPI0032DB63A0
MSKKDVVIVRPRIYIGENISVGPGKIDLLKKINVTSSIAAAARELELPYKRAWLLIDSLNQGFGQPVVATSSGGKKGGGSVLTPLGIQLIELYDALEEKINITTADELKNIQNLV